jgi:hypothetical protein
MDPDRTFCWFGGDQVLQAGRPTTAQHVIDSNGPGLSILATPHLDEGWNFPTANAMLLHHGKDRIAITQRSGRVIRKSSVAPILINFSDDYSVFSGQASQRLRSLTSYYKTKAVQVAGLKELKELLNAVK